jgi:phospholipase A2
VARTPELKLPIILGIVGSAFCATLSHYYAEIRPFLPTSYAIFRSLDELMKEVILYFLLYLTGRKILI